MNEIAHAIGYLTGALGIGFAVGFGAFAGMVAATKWLGAFQINVKLPPIVVKGIDDIGSRHDG